MLAGTAGACNYDNPGFKLKGEHETTSGSPTTNDSVSATTEPGTPTTSTSTSSQPTTIDPDGSGSASSAMTTDAPTTGMTEDPSTGMPEEWDNNCPEADVIEVEYQLLADTFFAHASEGQGGGCDLGDGNALAPFCEDLAFGQLPRAPVFYLEQDAGTEDDRISAFAVKFEPKVIMDGPEVVPTKAFQDLSLFIFFNRVDGQTTPIPFELLQMDKDDVWPEGDNKVVDLCKAGDSSFRCRVCNMTTGDCKDGAWLHGNPYDMSRTVITILNSGFDVPKVNFMTPVEIPLPTAELEALAGTHQGFLVLPKPDLAPNTLEIATREHEGELAPRLIGHYCKKPQ